MDTNPNFERDLKLYTIMLAYIQSKDPDIKFLGVQGHTVGFEKNGRTFNHALSTWQCAVDPDRPGFTIDGVAQMVVDAMKDY